MVKKVKSPQTGRWIKVNGDAYKRLQAAGIDLSGAESMNSPNKQYPIHPNTAVSNSHLQSISAMKASHTGPTKGRGSRTKGWGAAAPKRSGGEREALMKECGAGCFLAPERLAFPICQRCGGSPCQCEVDCRALTAAKVRARQWKYQHVANAANRLIKEKCKGVALP